MNTKTKIKAPECLCGRSTALVAGWVLLAGDGPQPARQDSSGWRAGHMLAALDALNRSFPGSWKWPIACAGQSGGAKRASYLAPLLAAGGYRLAGIFLEAINEERITQGYRRFKPGRDFLRTPIFLSSGVRDIRQDRCVSFHYCARPGRERVSYAPAKVSSRCIANHPTRGCRQPLAAPLPRFT